MNKAYVMVSKSRYYLPPAIVGFWADNEHDSMNLHMLSECEYPLEQLDSEPRFDPRNDAFFDKPGFYVWEGSLRENEDLDEEVDEDSSIGFGIWRPATKEDLEEVYGKEIIVNG